jgi:hypothetical protein
MEPAALAALALDCTDLFGHIEKMKFRSAQPWSIATQQTHLNSTTLFLLLNVWTGLLLYAAIQGWLLG